MLPSFLLPDSGRRRWAHGLRRADHERPPATSTALTVVRPNALLPVIPVALHADDWQVASRRGRHYRSRNCRALRQQLQLQLRRRERQVRASVDRDQAETRALERELRAIREQVERLERQRVLLESAALTARANAAGHALAQVRQFYALFGNGYNPDKRPAESAVAARFLRSVMEEDVVCTEFRGVETFLQQYHVCTEGHRSMQVLFQDALVVNEGSSEWDLDGGGVIQVRANAVARFRVSRKTLRLFFPRIAGDEALTQRLVDKEYVFQYDKVFHFRGGRVFQHESKVDFVNSLLTMVQDPFVAAKLIEAWVMTKHGHLKVDAQVVEDRHQLQDAVLTQ